MAITTTEPALLRLLQLASMCLPVGGFAYSQGMEYAVEAGWLKDRPAVQAWLQFQLTQSIAHLDLPVIFRLYEAFDMQDQPAIAEWNALLLACRETSELKFSDLSMGAALIRLLHNLRVNPPLQADDDVSFVTGFSAAAYQWDIPARACALGFAWSWLENQVAAATKLVPLGQTDAQQLISALQPAISDALDQAESLPSDQYGNSLPGVAIASALHETQYSRLFRS